MGPGDTFSIYSYEALNIGLLGINREIGLKSGLFAGISYIACLKMDTKVNKPLFGLELHRVLLFPFLNGNPIS